MCGAVVLLQTDRPGVGILLLEIQDIFDISAPETVNGLVVVTHHAEILPPPCQERGQQILHMVGVLVLVHQHIAEFVLIVGQHLRLLPQKRHRMVDDVVEVKRVGRPELLCVPGVDLGDAGHLPVHLVVVLGRKLLRALIFVLGAADDSEDALGLKGLFVQVQFLQNVLNDPLGIIGVVDGKILVEADAVDIPPQDTDASGVEGGGPDVVGHRPQPGRQAVL